MKVEMEHRLTCRGPVCLIWVHSIWFQSAQDCFRHEGRADHDAGGNVLWKR